MAKDDELIKLIKDIIQVEMKKQMRTYQNEKTYYWVGEVDTVNSGNNTATILLPNQTTPTEAKQNKTNQTLVSGDKVYLFSPYGTIGSAWIDKAFKQYV